MKKFISSNQKILVLCVLMCFYMIILSACGGERYPMAYYDKDLTSIKKEDIKEAFDNKQFEKQQGNITNSDENEINDFDEDSDELLNQNEIFEIEDEYITYENNLYNNSNSTYNVNLSTTTLEDTYKYKIINKNIPDFDINDYNGETFETYSDIDSLGRCGIAFAMLGKDTMPKDGETRGSIGMIKPSGWQTPQHKYDFIDGNYLYNRCHLIGWQLSAETTNEKNIITGTRYLNTKGMLPLENQVANYIKNTNNHVLYRVTPIFEGYNLVASRIQVEAMSYEDNGAGIKFNILLENYEPNVHIDYATGNNWEENNNIIETSNDGTI